MAVTGKVEDVVPAMDTNQPLDVLLLQLNRMLRGWCAYFRPGVSSATFDYLSSTGPGSSDGCAANTAGTVEGTPPPLLRMVADDGAGAVQPRRCHPYRYRDASVAWQHTEE